MEIGTIIMEMLMVMVEIDQTVVIKMETITKIVFKTKKM